MTDADRFVGIQLGPISVADEGVEPLLDSFEQRFGINVAPARDGLLARAQGRAPRLAGSWKAGPTTASRRRRRFAAAHSSTRGPSYYRNTFIKDFRAADDELAGIDILEHVIPHTRARGMRTYIDLMEPMFNYAATARRESVDIPNLPQVLQVDSLGRTTSEPCLNNPDYRNWLHALVEDHCRNYAIDGIMWCNERRSPLDAALIGKRAALLLPALRRSWPSREGIDVERARAASHAVWEIASALRRAGPPSTARSSSSCASLYRNPEALVWERFWVERNKALDRELYGIVKFCNPELEFGLNVWNRNHLNPWRKAQWPWASRRSGPTGSSRSSTSTRPAGSSPTRWTHSSQTIFRDLDADQVIELTKTCSGSDEARWAEIIQNGFDPDTYVFGQAQDTLEAVDGKLRVYMGVGVDAPRSRADQAVCTPDIVRRSVLATYRAGAHGVIFGPAYAGMNLTTLDGGADALRELGLFEPAAAGVE